PRRAADRGRGRPLRGVRGRRARADPARCEAGRGDGLAVDAVGGSGRTAFRVVNDHLADTPAVSRPWRPGCEPAADPLTEIIHEAWCGTHRPGDLGLDDTAVPLEMRQVYINAGTEADAEAGRRLCALIHRKPLTR